MKTFRRLPFLPSDIQDMAPMVEEGPLLSNADMLCKHASNTWTDSQGTKVFCGGLVIMWSGLAITWAQVSERFETSPSRLAILKDVRLWHKQMAIAYKLRRMQSDVRANFEKGQRLVKVMGYHNEGLMPDYGPEGEDMYRYAWLTKDYL